MQTRGRDGNGIALTLTREELGILSNALNEALEALDERAFEPRVGCAKAEAERLLEALGRLDAG